MHCYTFVTALLLGGLLTVPRASAAEFCAQSAAQIQAALTAAQSNGEDDWVYVESGSYTLSAPLVYSSSEPNSISIFGGASAGCMNFTFDDTILDGQHGRALCVGRGSCRDARRFPFSCGRPIRAAAATIRLIRGAKP